MLIFFDLDGTLTEISKRHFRVYREVVIENGGTPLGKKDYWERKRSNTAWSALLTASSINPAQEKIFLNRFTELIESPEMLRIDRLLSGSAEILARLKEENRLWLVSLRRNGENLVSQLEWLGISSFFERVITGHSDTLEGVLSVKAEAINRTEEDVAGALFVGDTEADISAARILNICSVAVTSGIRSPEYLAKLEPDFIIGSVGQLEEVLIALRHK